MNSLLFDEEEPTNAMLSGHFGPASFDPLLLAFTEKDTKVGAKNMRFLLHLIQSYMKCKDFARTHRTPVVGLVKFLRIHEDLFTATASRQFCVNSQVTRCTVCPS